MVLSPQFLADTETHMQALSEEAFADVNKRLWWPLVMKVRKGYGRTDVLTWLLATAKIRDRGRGGSADFDDLAQRYTEIENKFSGASLSVRQDELEDLRQDGSSKGVDVALEWAKQISGSIAHWPQVNAADLMMRGHLAGSAGGADAYDGRPFFDTAHPVNPFRVELGTYSNLFTGADACPIDTSVTAAVARANLGKAYGLIATIPLDDGEGLRCLRPKALIVPPKLFPRACEITGAQSLSVSLRSGESIVEAAASMAALGLVMPVMASELAGFEDDTTFFIAAEQVDSTQLGALVYLEREPYAINYYGPESSSLLSTSDKVEWHVSGRNRVAPGHPFLLFKVKAS